MTEKEELEMIEQMKSSALEWDRVAKCFEQVGKNTEEVINGIIGLKFDNGFTIDENLAIAIIKANDPGKLELNAKKFTIDTVQGITMIIAMSKDNIILYAIELPEEETTAPEYMHLQESIDDIHGDVKRAKIINWVSYVVVVGLVIGAVVFMYMNK